MLSIPYISLHSLFYFNALMFTYSICSSLTLIILLCSASYPLSQCHTKFACTMGVHFYPIIFLYFISALLYVSFSLRLSFNLWFQLFPLYFWNPTRSWAVHASDQWNQCFEKPNTPYFLWRFRFTNLGKMHFSFFRLPKKICRKVLYVSSRSLKKYDRSRTTYRLDGDILCTNNFPTKFLNKLKNIELNKNLEYGISIRQSHNRQ